MNSVIAAGDLIEGECGPEVDPRFVDPMKRIMSFKPFNEVLAILGNVLPHKKLVIAGGAIRDLYIKSDDSLIKDIDVFVLDTIEEADKADCISRCARVLHGSPYRPAYEGTPFNVLWNSKFPEMKPASKSTSILVRLSEPFTGKRERIYPVQIIAHEADTVDKLIADFDWRLCQFAYNGSAVWKNGLEDFYENKLTLGTVRNAFYTLRRGFYLENKFAKAGLAVKMRDEVLLTLASMMLLDPDVNKDGRI